MTQPWIAEFDVSTELAHSLIIEQFPQFSSASIALLGAGCDVFAFLLDDQIVFRFPRRQLGAECVETETRILPQLATRLPLPVPNPQYVGEPTERFPWLFVGYPFLQGRTACARELNDEERIATIPALTRFLSELHSLSAEWSHQIGAPEDKLGRLDPTRRIPQAHNRIETLSRQGLLTNPDLYCELIDQTATARAQQSTSLVHGDLYIRHILIDDDVRPCGIIDWGDLHVGDIALDLSIAFSFLPPSGRKAFRQAYGSIDDVTWRLARFRGLTYGLFLTEFARSISDADLFREGQWILKAILIDEDRLCG